MNQTPNYALNQWEASDPVQRADFNADNAKIDAALAGLGNCRIECGSYVGTGISGGSEGAATVLQLGFQPKLVIVKSAVSGMGFFVWPTTQATHLYSGGNGGTGLNVAWSEDGLKWWLINTYRQEAAEQLNTEGTTYYYIAFR